MLLGLVSLLLLVPKNDGDGGGLHGDEFLLLILSIIQIAQLCSDQAVGQSCLAMVNVGQNADIPYS